MGTSNSHSNTPIHRSGTENLKVAEAQNSVGIRDSPGFTILDAGGLF